MPKRVLDTNILIDHLRRRRPHEGKGPSDAAGWARELIENKGTDAIVSPVVIEILVGVRDAHDLAITEAFLGIFRVIDEGKVLPADRTEAARIAKRVVEYDRDVPRRRRKRGREPRPMTGARDFGDCLITAIARRLNHEVDSGDVGLHRQAGRTSIGG